MLSKIYLKSSTLIVIQETHQETLPNCTNHLTTNFLGRIFQAKGQSRRVISLIFLLCPFLLAKKYNEYIF